MTQIRTILMLGALGLFTLVSARPAEACGGYLPLTEEDKVTGVVHAHLSWLARGEIDSLVRIWPDVERPTIEGWAGEVDPDQRLEALETRVAAGRVAVVRVTLVAGDRRWNEYYLLRKRDGTWAFAGGAGVTPGRAIAARD